jgi:K+-sensing histidine kinase KdpD
MLTEGRLAESDRAQAYAQIERAARRLTSIGQQASDLAHWLRPSLDGATPMDLSALVAQALTRVATPDRVVTHDSIETSALKIPAIDREALTSAMSAVIDAVCRETIDDDVCISARVDRDAGACDILIGPAEVVDGLPDHAARDGSTTAQMSAEREGLGLALVVSAVVVLAHGGQLSTVGGRRDVIALRLLTETEGV